MSARVGLAPALAAAVAVNLLAAVQARVNADLGSHLHDAAVAALVSTGVGFVVVSAVLAVGPRLRAGLGRLRTAVRTGVLPWPMCLGGVCGGFYVVGQAMSVPHLGVAPFTVAVVAGTSVGSLVVDARGWAGAPPRPVTGSRALGAALVLGAVVLAGYRDLDDAAGAWLLLPVFGGVAIAWQTGANGLVRQLSDSAAAATWLNFALAAGSLVPVVLVVRIAGTAGGAPLLPHAWPGVPWAYAGGVVGLLLILAATRLVAATGVLLFGLAGVAGQMLGALGLDLATHPEELSPGTWVAACLTLVGVAVAAAGNPAPRRRR